jgi:ribulose-phosphate 3-epimerase
MKCSTSLWSADLSDLAAEIKRVEPYSERFHLDVADGRFIDKFLFFPDLVKAMRPHTDLPFEIHLITEEPGKWVEPFVDAGGDVFIFYLNSDDDEDVIDRIQTHGKQVGISLRVADSLDLLEPYWEQISIVTIMGTDSGNKGVGMDPSVPARIARCRQMVNERGLNVEIEADAGIRRHTVPLLKAAGADYIVPGSLMFDEDPAQMRQWLDGLQ